MSNLKLGVIRSIANADRAKEIINQAKREHKRAVVVKSDKGWAIRITKPQSQIEKLLGYITRQNQREKSRLEAFISSLPPAKGGSSKKVARKQAPRKSGVGSARPEQITKALAKNSGTKLLTPSKSSDVSAKTLFEKNAKAWPDDPQLAKTIEDHLAEFALPKSSNASAKTLPKELAKAWPTDPEQGKTAEEYIAEFAPSKSSDISAEKFFKQFDEAWPTESEKAKTAQDYYAELAGVFPSEPSDISPKTPSEQIDDATKTEPQQAKTAQSFKESINDLPQSIAKTDALQTTEDKGALESLKPIEQSFLSPLKQKTQ